VLFLFLILIKNHNNYQQKGESNKTYRHAVSIYM